MREFEKIEKTETVTKVEEKLTKCTCDLCGKEGGPWGGDHWEDHFPSGMGRGAYINVCVMFEKGSKWPEGGDSKKETYDVCPECFDSTIRPLFKNPPRVKESDW